MRRAHWAWFAVGVVGCAGDDAFLVVTIDTRPAVHDIRELSVALSNAGTSREDTFAVEGASFPATFSVATPGRTGELGIAVEARDGAGLVVGRGSNAGQIGDAAVSVLLDSADFVVNTELADDQFPSDDFESHGVQISATADGTWTVVYRERCSTPCNMFARRFDTTGRPVSSGLAGGTNGFAISTELTTGVATPAVASSDTTTVAVWDFEEPASGLDGVACRAFDPLGNPSPQTTIVLETFPDVVSVGALADSTFAVQWTSFVDAAPTIKSAQVDSRCQPSVPVVVSTTPATGFGGARRGTVAANGTRLLYAWTLDGAVRGRTANTAPFAFVTSGDVLVVAKPATERVEHVRVAPLGTGFAVVVRWALDSGDTGPGRLELIRTDGDGQPIGTTLISTRSGTDFASREAFGVASRASDGALLVVWHSCEDNGDASGCGVFGRVVRSNGVPVGPEFELATTTELDQTAPSATALPGAFAATWRDTSRTAPDGLGSAARARIIYPAFDDARRVLGAACELDDCDPGLSCGPSSDGGNRCFATCDPAGSTPTCPEGGTCGLATVGSACLF